MQIAVWKTGHEIADTVAHALAEGFNADIHETKNITDETIRRYDAHIAYGILRGTADMFAACDRANVPWFCVDKGYFRPGHYDGSYRISCRGTQPVYDSHYPLTRQYTGELKPWRGLDPGKPVLVCPPTEHVMKFFGVTEYEWSDFSRPPISAYETIAIRQNGETVLQIDGRPEKNVVIRHKGDPAPINFHDYNYVLTFNSSVGWQALINGIPCLSDTQHSVVGSYYNTISIDETVNRAYNLPRKPLLDFMNSCQFTLEEFRKGFAWALVSYHLNRSQFTSVTIHAKQSPPMSANTPSASAQALRFQSAS